MVVAKADMGCIMSRIDDKELIAFQGKLASAINSGKVSNMGERPTHVIDIYKMRRGQYKNVRIWCKIDLGTGERRDLYMTRIDNEPLAENEIIELFSDSREQIFDWRADYIEPRRRET